MTQIYHLVNHGGFTYLDVNLMPVHERRMIYKIMVDETKKENQNNGVIDTRTIIDGLRTPRR